MAEKKIQKNDEDEKEAKEGELDADALDSAFDDHGFGDEESDHPVEIKPLSDDDAEDEDTDAEWNSYDDKDTY